MDLKLSTTQLDASFALSAYSAYKAGNHKEATARLLDILDMEPRNWQARLLLAVCYNKTGQNFAAQRALRYVYDNCPDADLKSKACLALQSMNATLQASGQEIPAEFGRFNEATGIATTNKPVPLDRIITFA